MESLDSSEVADVRYSEGVPMKLEEMGKEVLRSEMLYKIYSWAVYIQKIY